MNGQSSGMGQTDDQEALEAPNGIRGGINLSGPQSKTNWDNPSYLNYIFTSVKTYYFWSHSETTALKENILTPHMGKEERGSLISSTCLAITLFPCLSVQGRQDS